MSRTRVAILAAVGALLALFGGRWLAMRYAEALWYADLGRGAQFWRLAGGRLLWQTLTMAAASLWYAAHTLVVTSSIGAVYLPRKVGNLEISEAVPRGVLRAAAVAVALLLGGVTVLTFGDLHDLVTLYRGAAPLGLPEPVMGRDASFYVARLPLVETLQLMALISAVMALLVSAGLYALTGSLSVRPGRAGVTPHARAHLVVLLALLALAVAWGFQVDALRIVGGGGSRDGALSAVDRTMRVPACALLAGLGLILAAVTVLWMRWGRGVSLAGVWAAYALLAVAARYAVPAAREAWGRPPRPSVAAAMADLAERYSRAGLGVAGVRAEVLPAGAEAGERTLSEMRSSLAGFSAWAVEPEVLVAWLGSQPGGGSGPRRWTFTVSAYRDPDGALRPGAIAVPETDVAALPRSAGRPSWDSLHRGALAWGGDPLLADLGEVPAARAGGGSAPVPTVARPSLGPVRFLAYGAGPGIVGEDARRPGEAPVGVSLRGLFRRVALAWSLQAAPLLDRRTVGERLLYWRDLPERLPRLYPFAAFESARAVVAGGRLYWVVPGLLASSRFPLAEQVAWRGGSVSFLRAPYLATVDAASGATRLYLRGPDTAVAARLAAAFGAEALPEDSIPADIRDHVGYPRSLLAAQTEVLVRHRGEPGQREWAVAWSSGPGGPGGIGEREPAAVEAVLDVAGTTALWRLIPLVDPGGNRLVGFVGAPSSGAMALEPRLFRLPSTDFPTLAAAESRLGASPAVVGAVAGAADPEGAVHRSPVVAIPVAGTVAYAQVLYSTARRSADPLRVHSVALMVGGRVGVGPDVPAAVAALASARWSGAGEARADTTLAAVRTAFLALDSAARRGDWPAFGRAMDALRSALNVVRAPGQTGPGRPPQ